MSLRYLKPWIRSMCVFCTLLALIVMSSHTTHAAATSPLKLLETEPIITLQADNGLYLSRINHGGINGTNTIEAAKTKVDAYSKFKIVRLDSGYFTLQADNGLYLSRINHGGVNGTNPIEAAKTKVDPSSQFTIIVFLANGKVALSADNGLYLSRINYGGINGTNPIEAAKSTTDAYSQFTMDFLQ
jgi:hypothetical protein